jgi:hypothetical protein
MLHQIQIKTRDGRWCVYDSYRSRAVAIAVGDEMLKNGEILDYKIVEVKG